MQENQEKLRDIMVDVAELLMDNLPPTTENSNRIRSILSRLRERKDAPTFAEVEAYCIDRGMARAPE